MYLMSVVILFFYSIKKHRAIFVISDPAMRAQDIDDCLSAALYDPSLDRLQWILLIRHHQPEAIEIEFAFAQSENIRRASIESDNIPIVPIFKLQLRIHFLQKLIESS